MEPIDRKIQELAVGKLREIVNSLECQIKFLKEGQEADFEWLEMQKISLEKLIRALKLASSGERSKALDYLFK
jgi:hypothetical protein